MVECRYCQTHIDTGSWTTTQDSAQARSQIPGSRLMTLGLIVVVVVAVAGTLAAVIVWDDLLAGTAPSASATTDPAATASSLSQPTSPPTAGNTALDAGSGVDATAGPEPSPAHAVLEFGEQGKEPGQLSDPRQIAVSADGDIFVADYRSLRVQRFDPTGKFVQQYKVRRGSQSEFITGLAADRKGHLWISRGGDLLKIGVRSGRLLSAKMHRAPKLSYGSVAVGPKGELYVQNFGSTAAASSSRTTRTDALRKLSPTGRLLERWTDVASGPVAVAPTGTVYVADKVERRIDVLSPEGKIERTIDGAAHKEWDLGFVSSLAVDGQGHLYVLAGDIHILDASGKHLVRFDSKGARSIALDPSGALYTVTSYCRVIKYAISSP